VLSRAELLQVSGGSAAESALERLINARLLVAMESPTGESIEVVHEALLAAWPRVVRWRQEDAEGARLRDQVRVAARQWLDRGKPRGLLWRGEALTEYRLWRARYPGALTDNEEAFGAASLADAARAQRFRRIALGTVVAGLTIALVIFAKLRSEAEDNRQEAESNRAVADTNRARAVASEAEVKQSLIEAHVEQGRRSLLEGKSIESLLYLHEAFRGGADTPAIRFMIGRALEPLDAEVAALRGHTGQLLDIAISPSGSQVATASDDGTVRVWDAATGAHRQTLTGPKGLMFAQWADDARLIWGGSDGVVAISDVASGAKTALPGTAAALNFMAIDAKRRHVLAATDAGVVRLWELATTASVELGKAKPGTRTLGVFSPRGDVVAIGSIDDATQQGGAALWTIKGAKLHDLQGHRAGVIRVAFDGAGDKLVTASADNTARIFDVRTGRSLHELRGHDQPVRDAAWSPDGRLIATASVDTTVRIWDPQTGETSRTLRGHTAQVNRVRFTADNLLLTASGDGTAKLWDPRRGQLLASFGHSGYLHTFDVDAKERRLATASWDGTAKLWHLDRRSSRSLVGATTSTPYVPPPLITPDGKTAIRHSDKGLELWSLADGNKVETPTKAPVCGRAIDATGKLIAYATNAGEIVVFEPGQSRSSRWSAGHPLTAIAMAPAGDRVVTSGADGLLTIWGLDGAARTTSKLPQPATALEWSADGTA
ncbi:MAG: WD40 repeat domain-containing protein, partial [Deltaproteobacteria bacterium]|nr:WD40 repeat domain-containing protein [Deltaproteobacteria bacterium]